MSKTLLISSLMAACWLAAAAPQVANDGPGVTVSMNGAAVVHRTPLNYPPGALRAGVEGTVSVQVKLDQTGVVSDALVLAGPDELRKAALSSVLQWHFASEVAGTTRVIQVAFDLSKAEPAPVAGLSGLVQEGRIKTIRVTGVTEDAAKQLLATLPLHEGDQWNSETMQRANLAVKAFDEHLNIRVATGMRSADGASEVGLMISEVAQAPTPGRINVGSNVMGAAIVRKVAPVYPADAKAAHVQGVVSLAATVAKDGTMRELHVLSGPSELTQAAMDAVKQWVYRPTMLNGEQVEVSTTIDVNFTLNQ